MNVSYVAAGKPKLTGSVFSAPLGTEVPTNARDALSSDYADMGYSADDGVVNTNSPESEDIKAWGGTVVMSLLTEKPDTFKVKLIEACNPDVLKAVYGSDNVTVEDNGDIAVAADASDPEERVWVFDMILRNHYKRIVLPDAKLSEIGDIVYKDDEVVGYEVTFTCLPDSTAKTHYEYLTAIDDEESES